jgi:hypothetical protein
MVSLIECNLDSKLSNTHGKGKVDFDRFCLEVSTVSYVNGALWEMNARGRSTMIQLQDTLARGTNRGCGIQIEESGNMSMFDVLSGDIKPSKEGVTLGNAI